MAGLPVLAFATVTGIRGLGHRPAEFTVLLACIVLGELCPIYVPRDDESEELTVSTTFAFAALLIVGYAGAAIAMAAASATSDAYRRRGSMRMAFNIAQYTL